MKALARLSRIAEEVLPFAFYWFGSWKQTKRAASKGLGELDGPYKHYHELSEDELKKRLGEEQDRATAMDEKTFKMTLSFTVALTVFGSTAALLVQGVPFDSLRPLITILVFLTVLYSLFGGFLALGALRTLPTFGYGTNFLIQAKLCRVETVRSLAAQETMNIVRHLRNESAYQCLRNGFLCLFAAVILYAASVGVSATPARNAANPTPTSITGANSQFASPVPRP